MSVLRSPCFLILFLLVFWNYTFLNPGGLIFAVISSSWKKELKSSPDFHCWTTGYMIISLNLSFMQFQMSTRLLLSLNFKFFFWPRVNFKLFCTLVFPFYFFSVLYSPLWTHLHESDNVASQLMHFWLLICKNDFQRLFICSVCAGIWPFLSVHSEIWPTNFLIFRVACIFCWWCLPQICETSQGRIHFAFVYTVWWNLI